MDRNEKQLCTFAMVCCVFSAKEEKEHVSSRTYCSVTHLFNLELEAYTVHKNSLAQSENRT